jgi:hypothetical protein
MNIYLFANNPKINQNIIDKLNINKDDVLMCFNHCSPLELLKNYTNEKIICIRSNHHNTYWGIDKLEYIHQTISKLFFIGPKIENFNYEKYITNNISEYIIYEQNISFDTILNDTTNNDKIPSTGFIGYDIAKKYYPKYNIFLVGFDAPNNINYYKWEFHDFEYEQSIYELDG